jgi:hypothetical protein
MVVKFIHYDYVLECGHNAVAEITWYTKREPEEPVAWHEGQMVKCQDCQYELRKIVDEKKRMTEE